jgi:hypothetical protein
MNTQEMIAIKAKFQNEFRRFSLPLQSSVETLEANLKTLFSLTNPVVIKYTDDEGDLCTITTQPELDCAVSMSKGLLRVTLFVAPQPQINTPAPCSVPVRCPGNPRPGCQQKNKQFWIERIQNKHAQLISKRDALSTKLAQDSITPEQKRVLTLKIERIQHKLTWIESKQQQMSQNPQEHPWKGRGRCGGKVSEMTETERKQHRTQWMEKKQQMLNAKKELITAKLADGSIAPERKQFLNAKLQKNPTKN